VIFLFCILFSIPLANEKEDKTVPKFNIYEDRLNLKLDMGAKNIAPKNADLGLISSQINKVKEKAKNFIPVPVSSSDIAIIKTSHGTMTLELYPDKAPNHCKNFKKLANSGFYDKTLFHRVIPGFMIQGGDILSRDNFPENDGTGNPGWTIDQEFNDIRHKRGILSMARSRDVNSAGSQFFICVDQAYHLDLKYTAFGNVIDGDEILDIITRIPSEAKQVFKSFKTKIPEHKSEENWMEYPFNGKTFYVKIPRTTTADIYKDVIKKQLKNKHRPFIPVIIESIRVVDPNNSLNE